MRKIINSKNAQIIVQYGLDTFVTQEFIGKKRDNKNDKISAFFKNNFVELSND